LYGRCVGNVSNVMMLQRHGLISVTVLPMLRHSRPAADRAARSSSARHHRKRNSRSAAHYTEGHSHRCVAAGKGPEKLNRLTGRKALDQLQFTLPFLNVTPWAVLAFLAAVVVLMCFSPGYVVAVIVGPIWIAACWPPIRRLCGGVVKVQQYDK
jgi:Flp pilus assembly protein TadB